MEIVNDFLKSYLSSELDMNKYLDKIDNDAQVIMIRNKKNLIIGGKNDLRNMVSENHFSCCVYATIIDVNIIEGDDGLFLCNVKSIHYRKPDDPEQTQYDVAIVEDHQIYKIVNDKIKFLQHNWNNTILDRNNDQHIKLINEYPI